MLEVIIPACEIYDEGTESFSYKKEQKLTLEHSLVSIAKWESKWCKPFLSTTMNREESIDYIRCMTLTQNVQSEVYDRIPDNVMNKISDYINAPMTATWFSNEKKGKASREIVTAEIIYHWMIAFQIPIKFEKWHLNRLMTLIRVCEIKNAPPKKMGKKTTMSRNAAINAARRQQLGSRG